MENYQDLTLGQRMIRIENWENLSIYSNFFRLQYEYLKTIRVINLKEIVSNALIYWINKKVEQEIKLNKDHTLTKMIFDQIFSNKKKIPCFNKYGKKIKEQIFFYSIGNFYHVEKNLIFVAHLIEYVFLMVKKILKNPILKLCKQKTINDKKNLIKIKIQLYRSNSEKELTQHCNKVYDYPKLKRTDDAKFISEQDLKKGLELIEPENIVLKKRKRKSNNFKRTKNKKRKINKDELVILKRKLNDLTKQIKFPLKKKHERKVVDYMENKSVKCLKQDVENLRGSVTNLNLEYLTKHNHRKFSDYLIQLKKKW